MKQRYSFVVALLSTLLFFLLPLPAPVHAASTGSIYGQLLNATKNNVPVSGQRVTLQKIQDDTASDFVSITTNAQGAFSFSGLDTSKTINYAVYTRYQGAQYFTNLIDLSTKPVQQINLAVYEATTSTAKIAITQAIVVLSEPDKQTGLITVSEYFFLKNQDRRTYVGSLNRNQGRLNALFFSLPPGARNISLSKGFDGFRILLVDRGFVTDAAVPPDISQFVFSFDVPYTTSQYDFSYSAMYPTTQLSVLVPSGLQASSSTLTSIGLIILSQSPYHLFQGRALLAGTQVHLQIGGLAQPKPADNASTVNQPALMLMVGLLIMLALLFVIWFLYHPAPQPLLQMQGQQANGQHSKDGQAKVDMVQDQQQALLQKLLELDRAFEAGKIKKAIYQERRAKTKAQLHMLMIMSRQ